MGLPLIQNDLPIGRFNNQPSNKNPLLETRFKFEIRRLPNTTYFCQSANIPGVSITAINQPTNFNPIKRPGGEIEQDFLNLRFIVDENLKNWNEIFKWIRECSNYTDFAEYKTPDGHLEDDAVLYILESNQQANLRVNYQGIFPVKLSGLNFMTTAPSAEPMIADVSFAITSFVITDI